MVKNLKVWKHWGENNDRAGTVVGLSETYGPKAHLALDWTGHDLRAVLR